MRGFTGCFVSAVVAAAWGAVGATGADQPQWGERFSRNMISRETGISEWFDSGRAQPSDENAERPPLRNVRWTARLGKQTYGTPVVAEGRVLVGTNNEVPRDPRIPDGDRAVLMCFDEKSGEFLWQLNSPKLFEHKWSDWYFIGMTSAPVVENGRVYLVTNRCEVMCLDLAGMADGNQGPCRDEGLRMISTVPDPAKETPPQAPAPPKPLEPGPKDADILWSFNMFKELGVRPHNASNCAPLLVGDLLYVCTSNGADWEHLRVSNPKAPSLVVIHKKTGKLVAVDDFNIGPDIFHGQWSSPSLGRVNGRDLVFFGAGNGFIYAVEALDPKDPRIANAAKPSDGKPEEPIRLTNVWKFNGQPQAQTQDRVPLEHIHDSHSYEVTGCPVFYRGRVYALITQEAFHGMKEGWFVCLDADGRGDITRTGLRWSYRMGSGPATPAVHDGLVYIVDYWGKLYCLDAESGKCYWTFDVGHEVAASPMIIDGKLYVAAAGRLSLWIMALGKEAKVIQRVRLRDKIFATPVAADGVLYLATTKRLYAVQGNAPKPPDAPSQSPTEAAAPQNKPAPPSKDAPTKDKAAATQHKSAPPQDKAAPQPKSPAAPSGDSSASR